MAQLLFVGQASATNWFGRSGYTGCNGGNQADNNNHSSFRSNLTSALSVNMNWADTNVISGYTNINFSYPSAVDSFTDLVSYDQDYTTYCGFAWHGSGGGTVGLTQCISLSPSNACEQHHNRYDISYTSTASDLNIRKLVVHEEGHSLGLKHRDAETGPMKTIFPPDGLYYNAHDRAHIATLS